MPACWIPLVIWPALRMQAFGAPMSVDGSAATPRTSGGGALFAAAWTYLAFP